MITKRTPAEKIKVILRDSKFSSLPLGMDELGNYVTGNNFDLFFAFSLHSREINKVFDENNFINGTYGCPPKITNISIRSLLLPLQLFFHNYKAMRKINL